MNESNRRIQNPPPPHTSHTSTTSAAARAAVLGHGVLRAIGLGGTRSAGGGEDDADNETVEGKRLGENEDEEHTGEELGLLSVGAHAGVTDDADGHAGGEAGETARETRCEMRVTLEQRVTHGVDGGGDDDGNNETVDTQHTSHDHGDDGLHDELGTHHTHGSDTDARLGGTVRRTHACCVVSRACMGVEVEVGRDDMSEKRTRMKGHTEERTGETGDGRNKRRMPPFLYLYLLSP